MEINSIKIISFAVIMCCSFLGYDAFSATQGNLNSDSTGTLNIRITKPARASISNLSDMSVSNWLPGGGDQTLINDVCVYSSRQNGGYTVKATGSGTAGAFLLAGNSGTLPYSVNWNDNGVGNLNNSGASLTPTFTSGGLQNAATDSATCNGAIPGPTARLIVTILASNLDQISAGIYTGSLTLLITPN